MCQLKQNLIQLKANHIKLATSGLKHDNVTIQFKSMLIHSFNALNYLRDRFQVLCLHCRVIDTLLVELDWNLIGEIWLVKELDDFGTLC